MVGRQAHQYGCLALLSWYGVGSRDCCGWYGVESHGESRVGAIGAWRGCDQEGRCPVREKGDFPNRTHAKLLHREIQHFSVPDSHFSRSGYSMPAQYAHDEAKAASQSAPSRRPWQSRYGVS